MVVLASASPRRRDLLARICPDFETAPAEIDETLEGRTTPDAVAALALRKARVVAARRQEGVVLGADTVVVIDGEALGKPATDDEARVMLRRLRGRHHEVVTGIAAVDAATGREAATAVVSRVLMEDYPDGAIDAYVATGEPLDKAGAYAIQGEGGRLVAGWAGSFSNIVGLPLEATRRLLAAFGVAVSPDVGGPAA
ncbi:MAG: septum formation protein Maf [Candidatus Rokubacteria bacterium]|nr:septum formation protein Maf [Candidatus Rokubacteria bacterium]